MEKRYKAYKVFDKFLKCRDFQFEIGETYTHTDLLIPCQSGFHACAKLIDCFHYKPFSVAMRVCEVELNGQALIHTDKYCAEFKYEVLNR